MAPTLQQEADRIANANGRQERSIFRPTYIRKVVRAFGAEPTASHLLRVATATAITKHSSEDDVFSILRKADRYATFIDVIPEHAASQMVRDPNDIDTMHKAADRVRGFAIGISNSVRKGYHQWLEHRLHYGEINSERIRQLVTDAVSGNEKANVMYTALAGFIRSTTAKNAIKLYSEVKSAALDMDLAPSKGKRLDVKRIDQCHKMQHLMVQAFNNGEIKKLPEVRNRMVTDRDRLSSYLMFNINAGMLLERNNTLTANEKEQRSTLASKFAKVHIFSNPNGVVYLDPVLSGSSMGFVERRI